MTTRRPFVVGLTGGIGSGKSTVADLFQSLGAVIIDADVVAHAISQAGQPGALAVADAFGASALDQQGAIDRNALRAMVFNDPSARKKLESLLHPLIRLRMDACLKAAPAEHYVLWVVPLLIESAASRERCDRIAVVDCPEAEQIRRVILRSGLAETQVRAIMHAQATRAQRLALADDVIDNTGGREALVAQVHSLHAFYSQHVVYHA